MGGVIGIVLLDETIVATALPTMRHDLALSQVRAHWVINVYLLVFAGFAAAGGKLGDIFGHRAPFLLSLGLFGLASVACGFAESGSSLIAARAVQGLGGAMVFPLSMAMITVVFPREQRGMALGVYGAIGTTLQTLGPLLGGFFTETVSWRWIFWINIPIVVAIGLVVLRTWDDPPRTKPAARIDFRGLLTLVAGISAVVFALMQGPEWGWENPAILTAMGFGIAAIGTFYIIERRIPAPLIEVGLFRNASFSACNLVVFTAQYCKMSAIVFGAFYLQDILKMSPLMAGPALMLAVGPFPLMAAPSGRLADRFGARPLVLCGLALAFVAYVWLGLATRTPDFAVFAPALIVWGFGVILLFAPPRSAIMQVVPLDKHGQVGGVVMTAQILGGTLGMAICSTLYVMTRSFAVVFFANAAVVLFVFVLALCFIERAD